MGDLQASSDRIKQDLSKNSAVGTHNAMAEVFDFWLRHKDDANLKVEMTDLRTLVKPAIESAQKALGNDVVPLMDLRNELDATSPNSFDYKDLVGHHVFAGKDYSATGWHDDFILSDNDLQQASTATAQDLAVAIKEASYLGDSGRLEVMLDSLYLQSPEKLKAALKVASSELSQFGLSVEPRDNDSGNSNGWDLQLVVFWKPKDLITRVNTHNSAFMITYMAGPQTQGRLLLDQQPVPNP